MEMELGVELVALLPSMNSFWSLAECVLLTPTNCEMRSRNLLDLVLSEQHHSEGIKKDQENQIPMSRSYFYFLIL